MGTVVELGKQELDYVAERSIATLALPRLAVHWAVLNGKADALAILLEMGCSANPFKPKESQVRSSIAVESPLEICERLHGESSIGKRMKELLLHRMQLTAQ